MMKKEKSEKFLARFYRGLICVLPAVLFFSYYPVISLGASESMNFEFSLPLIWLVVFDVLAMVIMVQRKLLFRDFKKKCVWLLFPGFLSLSLLWSLNFVRGFLTVGILWLVYFAVYAFFGLKSVLKEVGVKEIFWKVFFGSALLVCGWCVLQCALDLWGVSRMGSLMCAGCTYEMFGFPHPNGFAIEPQFMGNLLLAPAITSVWFVLKNKKYWWLFFIFVATMFLTFSRGAIYAFIIAMIFMMVMEWTKQKDWKVCKTFLIIAAAFLFTLNLQGIMAQVSPTDDTYSSGVTKVINQLSLGIIDIRGDENETNEVILEETNTPVLKKTDENAKNEKEQAVFDGYVEESTETRKRLAGAAFTIWRQDFKTVMFGVGLGGAGQALYANGLSPAPKEIVQNQYASLLLETGVVGIGLLILTMVLVFRVVYKNKNSILIFTLIVAYMVSLCFFSGLPNALHIYLLPAILMVILDGGKSWYRKWWRRGFCKIVEKIRDQRRK